MILLRLLRGHYIKTAEVSVITRCIAVQLYKINQHPDVQI